MFVLEPHLKHKTDVEHLGKTGVYGLINKIDQKIYVGSSSVNLNRRLNAHLRQLLAGIHKSTHLQNAVNKVGFAKNFEIVILEVCESEKCIEREQYWIDFHKSYDRDFGYNLLPKAASPLGYKHSEENKIKNFESRRVLNDKTIIEIFNLRNNTNMGVGEISKKLNVSAENINCIYNKPNKYKSVKEKYDLKKLKKLNHSLEDTDLERIYNMYVYEKLSIADISFLTGFSKSKVGHFITKPDIYANFKADKPCIIVEKGRQNKYIEKKKRKPVKKVNRFRITLEVVLNILKDYYYYYNNLERVMLYDKYNVSKKSLDLILNFRYCYKRYADSYNSFKKQYFLPAIRSNLTEQDIIDIFKDYNSGNYFMEELAEKYNYRSIDVILKNTNRCAQKYKQIINNNNNLFVDMKNTKQRKILSKRMFNNIKHNSKTYKIIFPDGTEEIVTNITDYSRRNGFNPTSMSRAANSGKKYRGMIIMKVTIHEENI